jgi:hypothetical protein
MVSLAENAVQRCGPACGADVRPGSLVRFRFRDRIDSLGILLRKRDSDNEALWLVHWLKVNDDHTPFSLQYESNLVKVTE